MALLRKSIPQNHNLKTVLSSALEGSEIKNIKIKTGKSKWVPDAAITIAILSLLLSVVQLVVTAPLLASLFYSPRLIISCSGSEPTSDVLTASCHVENKGNAIANEIEVGLSLEEHQRMSFAPNLVSEVIEEPKAVFIKNVKVKIQKLHPNEGFEILILPGPNLEKLNSAVANMLKNSGVKQMPSVSYIRSTEGVGKVEEWKPRKKSL